MADRGTEVRESVPQNSCLVGNLATWPLVDLLMWLNQSGRTAMVRIGVGLDAGVIFLNEGYLYRCEWGPLKGEDALIGLLGLAEGSFSLVQRALPEARPNIMRPTAELLLQCSIALDEHRRPVQA